VGDQLPVDYKLNSAIVANACTPLAGARLVQLTISGGEGDTD